jgi:hypothetical protein
MVLVCNRYQAITAQQTADTNLLAKILLLSEPNLSKKMIPKAAARLSRARTMESTRAMIFETLNVNSNFYTLINAVEKVHFHFW